MELLLLLALGGGALWLAKTHAAKTAAPTHTTGPASSPYAPSAAMPIATAPATVPGAVMLPPAPIAPPTHAFQASSALSHTLGHLGIPMSQYVPPVPQPQPVPAPTPQPAPLSSLASMYTAPGCGQWNGQQWSVTLQGLANSLSVVGTPGNALGDMGLAPGSYIPATQQQLSKLDPYLLSFIDYLTTNGYGLDSTMTIRGPHGTGQSGSYHQSLNGWQTQFIGDSPIDVMWSLYSSACQVPGPPPPPPPVTYVTLAEVAATNVSAGGPDNTAPGWLGKPGSYIAADAGKISMLPPDRQGFIYALNQNGYGVDMFGYIRGPNGGSSPTGENDRSYHGSIKASNFDPFISVIWQQFQAAPYAVQG